jgi:uncharacterized protein YegP (UPF0339 family)
MHFEVYQAGEGGQKGQWRWRLHASNGQVIATSGEGYVDRADCERMIAHIQAGCPSAAVKGPHKTLLA